MNWWMLITGAAIIYALDAREDARYWRSVADMTPEDRKKRDEENAGRVRELSGDG